MRAAVASRPGAIAVRGGGGRKFQPSLFAAMVQPSAKRLADQVARKKTRAPWHEVWLRRPGGSAPWTQDGVPPLSLALRGGSLLYRFGRTVDPAVESVLIQVTEQIKW